MACLVPSKGTKNLYQFLRESNPLPNLKPNESKSDTLEIEVALFFLNQFQLG